MIAHMVNKKVLVVDDQLEMRIFFFNLLQNNGFEPIEVDCGTDCLRMAAENRPLLIVLNGMMGGKGDKTLYQMLKRDPKLKQIPIVMISALDRETFYRFHKIRAAGARNWFPAPEAYLKKPLDAAAFMEVVEKLTEQKIAATGRRKEDWKT